MQGKKIQIPISNKLNKNMVIFLKKINKKIIKFNL